MSDLQKSKRFDLIDMFNDTSRYLDDIFTIDNLVMVHNPAHDLFSIGNFLCRVRVVDRSDTS